MFIVILVQIIVMFVKIRKWNREGQLQEPLKVNP